MIWTLSSVLAEMVVHDTHCIAALDGRCAAGKTTLAEALSKRLLCNVVHMDDFFLRPEQRTPNRLVEVGGNVDYERVLEEVLLPLSEGKLPVYCPFDCHTQTFQDAVQLKDVPLTIVEGAYACHPKLWEFYALHIFLDIDADLQMERIRRRNSSMADLFQNRWIPLEELYFDTFRIQQKCAYQLGQNNLIQGDALIAISDTTERGVV